ncbi:HAD family hydrolase [Pseudonocardia acaciae]|uniref:HAD family hydrolase n=1 Tax=Pseudonocardia acaciae TaxID=551276 RepID=UPI000686F837|nr:HAD family hydrolase [Pseudonocardia acaciae]
MRKVAIFDLDGTLVDTPTGIVRSFAAAFTELGVPVPAADSIRATIGIPLTVAFAGFLGVTPDDRLVASAVARYQVAFAELVLPKAADLVYPGVVDGLEGLERDGFALAVATSKLNAGADALLTAAGIRDRFGVLVGADQVSNPKPAPDSALLVLGELGARASDAIMVGDATHDLRMAEAAGVRSIAVTYGAHGRAELASARPTWLVDSFPEVVGTLRAAAGITGSTNAAPPPPR